MELKDKVVVITGGSSGLGKALAQVFAKLGSKVVITSNQQNELDQTAQELGIMGVFADVTNESQVEKVADETIKKFEGIDIWINNAGIWMPHGPIESMDMKKLHQLMEVNLFGMIYGSKAVLAQMRQQKSGAIVNIISIRALKGVANRAGYTASKFAARGFTESLREEVKEFGIKVIAVFPARMRTALFNDAFPQDLDKCMAPEDVAKKIVKNLEAENPLEEQIIKNV